MRILFVLVGIFLGLAFVRYHCLSIVQLLGLKMFVEGNCEIRDVLESWTFYKMLGGALVGGFLGGFLAIRVLKLR